MRLRCASPVVRTARRLMCSAALQCPRISEYRVEIDLALRSASPVALESSFNAMAPDLDASTARFGSVQSPFTSKITPFAVSKTASSLPEPGHCARAASQLSSRDCAYVIDRKRAVACLAPLPWRATDSQLTVTDLGGVPGVRPDQTYGGAESPSPKQSAHRRPIVAWAAWCGLLVGAAIALVACAGSERDGNRSAEKAASGSGSRRVGVTLLTKEQEFYRQLESGLRSEAAAKGLQLLVTSGDFDLAKQQSEIDNFIVQRVDAIVVCPVDSKGIGPAIQRATAAGIPVFTADIRAYGVPVVAHVSSDNREGGRQAARFMAQAIGDRGVIGIIGQAEVQTGYDRAHAFAEALASHPGIRVVGELNGGGVRDRALKAAEDMMQAHPDLTGIFAINDETALGALAAARARGKTAADFTVVGYDATPEAVAAIRAHSALKADVAQHPDQIGVRTIDAIVAHFAKQPVDSVITIPVTIFDASTPDPPGGRKP